MPKKVKTGPRSMRRGRERGARGLARWASRTGGCAHASVPRAPGTATSASLESQPSPKPKHYNLANRESTLVALPFLSIILRFCSHRVQPTAECNANLPSRLVPTIPLPPPAVLPPSLFRSQEEKAKFEIQKPTCSRQQRQPKARSTPQIGCPLAHGSEDAE